MTFDQLKKFFTDKGFKVEEELKPTREGQYLALTITHPEKHGGIRYRKDAMPVITDQDRVEMAYRVATELMSVTLQTANLNHCIFPVIENPMLLDANPGREIYKRPVLYAVKTKGHRIVLGTVHEDAEKTKSIACDMFERTWPKMEEKGYKLITVELVEM